MEILAAVQTRAQNEVAIEQCPGLAKQCEKIFTHPGSGRRGNLVAPNAFGAMLFFDYVCLFE